MQVLYPQIKPYKRHQLTVSDLHELYLDEAGNPDGIPVLFVHGGPGGACDASSRRFYDPALYRIICFDQRGCGRSTPHGELTENTTADLIADMEAIRELLSVERWVLFGGSWGSTLSLLYAQQHPERVIGLILRGIFLCRQGDFGTVAEGRQLLEGCSAVVDLALPMGTSPVDTKRLISRRLRPIFDSMGDIKTFIYGSTMSIYRLDPAEPFYRWYGVTKRHAELEATRLGTQFGRDARVNRPAGYAAG